MYPIRPLKSKNCPSKWKYTLKARYLIKKNRSIHFDPKWWKPVMKHCNTVTLILFLQTYVLIVTECIPLFFNQLGIRKLKHFPKGRWFLVSTMSSLTSSLTVPVLGSMPCNKAIKEKSFWNEIELLTCLTSVTVEFRTLIVMSWMNFSAGVVTRSNSCSTIVYFWRSILYANS